MGTQTLVQAPTSLSAATVSYLVFGKSLKMQALRHVLHTLEMRVIESVNAKEDTGELHIAFDGCDVDACVEKAEFIRSRSSIPAQLAQFPIGRVPEIAPLFEASPSLRHQQGTILDPEVEVFAGCWRSHRLRRFLERDGPDSINEFLTDPVRTDAALLRKYAGLSHEQAVAERFTDLIGMLEVKIEGWLRLKSQGETARLRELLAAWSKAKAPRHGLAAPGPLYDLCGYLRDLDEREKFGTTVAKLSETLMTPVAEQWHATLSYLQ